MAGASMNERCSWCGVEVEAGDGFRAYEPEGERRAVFCRLEHVVPWSIRGAHWDAGAREDDGAEAAPRHCAHCEAALDDVHVLLVRHRGAHRIGDAFCGIDHLNEWAKAGGRWQ